MGQSKSWLITCNVVLFAITIVTPALIGTPLRIMVLIAWTSGLSYALGLIAVVLAVWIASSKEFSVLTKIGNLALSAVTILICGFFSFMAYSCTGGRFYM